MFTNCNWIIIFCLHHLQFWSEGSFQGHPSDLAIFQSRFTTSCFIWANILALESLHPQVNTQVATKNHKQSPILEITTHMCVYYDILAQLIEKTKGTMILLHANCQCLPKIEILDLRFQIVGKIVKPNVIQILQMF